MNSHSIGGSSFIKFGMQVEVTYMYGFYKKLELKVKVKVTQPQHQCFLMENNNRNITKQHTCFGILMCT